MPTVRRIGSARFFFYSNEGSEPPHVHVEQGGSVAKFWLAPVSLAGVTSSSPSVDPRATDVAITDDDLTVDLADGRRVTVPLAWFPRLLHAKPDQRKNWRIIGDGQGIRWPDVDEDLSVSGLLRGAAAPDASKRAV